MSRSLADQNNIYDYKTRFAAFEKEIRAMANACTEKHWKAPSVYMGAYESGRADAFAECLVIMRKYVGLAWKPLND